MPIEIKIDSQQEPPTSPAYKILEAILTLNPLTPFETQSEKEANSSLQLPVKQDSKKELVPINPSGDEPTSE